MKASLDLNKNTLKQLFSKKFLLVILISIPSAIIADYFNIPLAWMLGPMLAVSIAALSGIKIEMPKLALSSILIILGLHIGNYIDQNLINQMTEWVWTSLIMCPVIVRDPKILFLVGITGTEIEAISLSLSPKDIEY